MTPMVKSAPPRLASLGATGDPPLAGLIAFPVYCLFMGQLTISLLLSGTRFTLFHLLDASAWYLPVVGDPVSLWVLLWAGQVAIQVAP